MSRFQQEMYTGSSNGGRSVAILTYTSKGQSMVEAGRGTWNFRRFVIVEIRLLQARSWRISCQSGSTWPLVVASDHLHTLPVSKVVLCSRAPRILGLILKSCRRKPRCKTVGRWDERICPNACCDNGGYTRGQAFDVVLWLIVWGLAPQGKRKSCWSAESSTSNQRSCVTPHNK